MNFPRVSSWLPIAGMLAAVAGGLAWLLLVFAGNQGGVQPWTRADSAEPNGATLEFFVEQGGGRMTREAVAQLPAEAWVAWTSANYYTGGAGAVLWARVTLRNAGARTQTGVLADQDFFADRVEAWLGPAQDPGWNALTPARFERETPGQRPEVRSLHPGTLSGDDGDWEHLVSGEKSAARDKAMPGRAVAFPVQVPARGAQIVYLRAEDFYHAFFRLEWWPEATVYHAAKTRGLIAETVYFGGMLALLGYNVLLWLRLRLTDMGYYAAYLGTAWLFMVLARAWGLELGGALGSPQLETVLTVALALSGFFLVRFARVFLELKTRWPRGDRIAKWLAVMTLTLAVGALGTPWIKSAVWFPATVFVIGITHGGLLVLAVGAWRAGATQAWFFILSFGCLFAGSLPMVAVWFWMLSPKHAALMGLMIGSALEMLLLSLAVADRFARAQRDKVAAQTRLIEESDQRRMIEETYADELELEVAERTHDLETANTDKDRMLIALGHDLRSPLAALTQRAEQLRALVPATVTPAEDSLEEFSGDVAGAGRQMLLLIEDIVLWARLRTGAKPALSMYLLRRIVMPVVKLHRPFAERRGVTLVVEVEETLIAWTDLVLAQTMVRNLVGNAVKFARSRVEVSAHADATTVRITVRDDGPGLPAGVLARLRGEAPSASEAGGGGMGLRLSQEIGGTLGATIDAVVPPGGGMEMRVTFPAMNPEQPTETTR